MYVMKSTYETQRGFSLIELVVVMAILLILVSFLFPVFNKAKYAAKEAVCISNVRQVYMALEMYASDHGGYPWHQPNHPSLSGYFSGTLLTCPIAEGKPSNLRYPTGDYLNTSTPPPLSDEWPEEIKRYNRLWAECRDKRGSEFPFVVDNNHTSAVERVERGVAFVILARAAGNAVKVPDRTAEFFSGAPSPCDPILTFLNL